MGGHIAQPVELLERGGSARLVDEQGPAPKASGGFSDGVCQHGGDPTARPAFGLGPGRFEIEHRWEQDVVLFVDMEVGVGFENG